MKLIDYSIHTIGMPKTNTCPHCKNITRFTKEERRNLAECILYNSAGVWALSHCEKCGWVDKIYPVRINGISCTKEECEKLIAEEK